MKNTENDYIADTKKDSTLLEKINPANSKNKPEIADPAEAAGLPAKILPITDKDKKGNTVPEQGESDQSDNSGAPSENNANV